MDLPKKLTNTLLALLLMSLVLGGYYVYNGFSLSFPPQCGYVDYPLEMDSSMKQYSVVFQENLNFVTNPGYENIKSSWRCPTVLAANYPSIMKGSELGSSYKIEAVPPNERFKIIQRIYVVCPRGWDCIGGGSGQLFILENSKGEKFEIKPLYFSIGKAVYYNNDKIVGPVKIDENWGCIKERNIGYCGQ